MDCRETRKWLSPYLDSELERTKTFEVSEHLRVCPPCAERFDQERRAEACFRTSINRDTMPRAVWDRISRDVATPAWVRALKGRRTLAIAAMIALVVLAWRVMPDRTVRTSPTWLVDRFVAETPSDRAFSGGPEIDSSVSHLLESAFGLSWPVSADAAAHAGHVGFEIINTQIRIDPSGRTCLEVRLNCCGQPMVVAFAATDASGSTSLDGLLAGDGRTLNIPADLNLATRRIGSVVAVAISRHSVEGMLDSVRQARG